MAVRFGFAGLRRFLQQASRSESQSLRGPAVSNSLSNPQVRPPLPALISRITQNSPTAQIPPALPSTAAYTLAASRGQPGRTFNTDSAATVESESGGDTGVINPGAAEYENAQRGNEERIARDASRDRLTEQIRDWPADVDLCEKFPDGQFSGRPIGAHDLRTAFYTLARSVGAMVSRGVALDASARKDATAGDVETTGCGAEVTAGDVEATGGGAEVTAGITDATAGAALLDNARRLLNVFDWWEGRGQSGSDVRLVTHPLLRSLAAAGRRDEIRSLWQRYQPLVVSEDKTVLQFMSASAQVQLYDDVVTMFETSKDQEWLIKNGGLDPVVKAMQGRGCSKNEVWAFYRGWVQKLGTSVCQRPGFVALLEAGVSVDELQTLTDKRTVYVQNRLVQALSTLGRRDEALALVAEYINGQDGTPMGISALVSYLRTLIQSGFVQEAQQLADQQEKLGVTLKGALIYIMNKGENRWTGLEAYTDLLALEGSHKTNKTVQALLVTNCYAKLNDTDAMYKAYLKGKDFEGEYHAVVFARVIEYLSQEGRAAEAEGVLADYYEARHGKNVISLRYSAYQSLAHMYLRTNQPRKVVDMVNEMINQGVFVNDWVTQRWILELESGDHSAEAQLVRDAQKRMRAIADAWWEKNTKNKAARGRVTGNRKGSGRSNGRVNSRNKGTLQSGEATEPVAEKGGVEASIES